MTASLILLYESVLVATFALSTTATRTSTHINMTYLVFIGVSDWPRTSSVYAVGSVRNATLNSPSHSESKHAGITSEYEEWEQLAIRKENMLACLYRNMIRGIAPEAQN